MGNSVRTYPRRSGLWLLIRSSLLPAIRWLKVAVASILSTRDDPSHRGKSANRREENGRAEKGPPRNSLVCAYVGRRLRASSCT